MELGRFSDPGEGDVIGERFLVERLLGKGGMGTVLAATDQKTGRRVALKIMRSMYAGDESLIERFRREAEVLAKIDHPAVVGVEDAGSLPDGNFFIALELLEGETLKRFVKREGRMPLKLLVPVVNGVCGGLAAAHAAGIVHRDVKPSNVFLPARPERSLSLAGAESLVKLVDFGVAKIAGARKLTVTGGSVGTFQYMAPEQLKGVDDIDGRADIYALGVVAYEALAGVHPFEEEAGRKRMEAVEAILAGNYPRIRHHRPELPVELEAVLAKAMHHDRDKRFQSADDFADAMTRVNTHFVRRETAPAPAMPSGQETAEAAQGPEGTQTSPEATTTDAAEATTADAAKAQEGPGVSDPAPRTSTRPTTRVGPGKLRSRESGSAPPVIPEPRLGPWILVAVVTAALVAYLLLGR